MWTAQTQEEGEKNRMQRKTQDHISGFVETGFWGLRSYLMHWTDCSQVWWACFSLRLQVERTSEMEEQIRAKDPRGAKKKKATIQLSWKLLKDEITSSYQH